MLTRELSQGEWGTLYLATHEDDTVKTEVLVKELQGPPEERWLNSLSELQDLEFHTASPSKDRIRRRGLLSGAKVPSGSEPGKSQGRYL